MDLRAGAMLNKLYMNSISDPLTSTFGKPDSWPTSQDMVVVSISSIASSLEEWWGSNGFVVGHKDGSRWSSEGHGEAFYGGYLAMLIGAWESFLLDQTVEIRTNSSED